MPRWKGGGRVFAAFSRRHGLNAPGMEVLTGVIPTAEVDRHYTDDRLNLWGLFMQQPGTVIANRLGACSLNTQENEALVHRVDVHFSSSLVTLGFDCHLFSPLQTYDPHEHNPFIGFPWLQPISFGEPGRLSRSFGLEGEQDTLQVVVVNTVAHVTVGPVLRAASSAAGVPGAHGGNLWGFQDPPWRLRPFTQLTVQMLVQLPVGYFLNVAFYYSERSDQGPVG